MSPQARWHHLLPRAHGRTGCGSTTIQNMAGDKHFAEIFFTDVQVPVENRLGAEGEGWKVTVSALANERSSIVK